MTRCDCTSTLPSLYFCNILRRYGIARDDAGISRCRIKIQSPGSHGHTHVSSPRRPPPDDASAGGGGGRAYVPPYQAQMPFYRPQMPFYQAQMPHYQPQMLPVQHQMAHYYSQMPFYRPVAPAPLPVRHAPPVHCIFVTFSAGTSSVAHRAHRASSESTMLLSSLARDSAAGAAASKVESWPALEASWAAAARCPSAR